MNGNFCPEAWPRLPQPCKKKSCVTIVNSLYVLSIVAQLSISDFCEICVSGVNPFLRVFQTKREREREREKRERDRQTDRQTDRQREII